MKVKSQRMKICESRDYCVRTEKGSPVCLRLSDVVLKPTMSLTSATALIVDEIEI